eukprot:6954359-Ditylum_brightwellii.AAC.1
MSCCKRKKLRWTEEEETARGNTQYALCPAMHVNSRMENGKKLAKAKYQQYTCCGIGCKKNCRTYCSCTVGQWLYKSCHMDHVVDEATTG